MTATVTAPASPHQPDGGRRGSLIRVDNEDNVEFFKYRQTACH
jgi:hypothetical protein